MQYKFHCVNVIDRSWKTWKMNRNSTHTPLLQLMGTQALHLQRKPLTSKYTSFSWQWLRATHTRDWEPGTTTLQALSLVESAEPAQVHFTLRLREQRSMWIQDGCKVYMESYMASNGSCFMVTWSTFKNRLLKVGLTWNRETMALWMLTTIDLSYFITCEDPHE